MRELEKLRALLRIVNVALVARECGVHPNSVYRLMRGTGTPSAKVVLRVAAYLEKQGLDTGLVGAIHG